jgi:cysteine/O-acetylserine efflux protein
MSIELIPLFSFVAITTFTPGPNNISSASMGIIHGYKKTINFLLGITTGFFVIMIASAFLSSSLLAVLPDLEKYLRWLGAFYIIWLAASIYTSDAVADTSDTIPKAFTKGFLLQLFNPKVMVYGFTLFSTFLASISNQWGYLCVFAAIFALTAFVATSTWALCGSAIKSRLKNDIFRKRVNGFLSILLLYTALDLSGIL